MSQISADPSLIVDAMIREAHTLIGRYGLSPDTTISLLSQSENSILLFHDPEVDREFVLRVHSQRLVYHTKPSIASELMWMRALRAEASIETPQIVSAADGSTIQTLYAPDFDIPRHAVMFTFLEGQEPSPDTLVNGFRQLGAITARMHRHAQSWLPPAEFDRHTWSCEAILGERPLWGRWQDGIGMDKESVAVLSRLSGAVERRIGRLAADRYRFGLIHADLRLANLLVEGDCTKVIDFDDCGFGWYIYDLATALSFLEEQPIVPDLVAAWLEGYRTLSNLPRDIVKEIPSFIMLRRLAEIAWLGTRRHLDFAQSLGAGFTTDSCRLAEDYLSHHN